MSAGRVSGSSAIERASDAEADRTGLAADATPVERGLDVVDLFGLREPERLLRDHLVREDREVRHERATVHGDLAGAVAHSHPRDGLLAPTGRLDQGLGQVSSFWRFGGRQASARARERSGSVIDGLCAWWGWVAPP